MENSLSSEEIRDFWHPIPGSQNGLNNKKGLARFVYLTLLHYFYYNHQFPDFNTLPRELLLYGLEHTASSVTIDEVSILFNNERQLYRYKDEIRTNLGYRLFEQKDIILLKKNLSVLFSGNANKDALQELLFKEFDKQKIERLNAVNTQNIINKIQYAEEQATFNQINSLLTEKDKAYIDDYILSSNDFGGICQFLRQDSGSTTRDNVKLEIKRLEILNALPLDQFAYLDKINPKQHNVYKRRFFTDTPQRTKRREDISRYALTVIFCYQRYLETNDNLIEHLLHFIHRIKKTADCKTKELHQKVGKKIGDLDLLYQLAEINRDFPEDIIAKVVYAEIPQATIDQLIKARTFCRNLKKTLHESVVKRYSVSYRTNIFAILECLDLYSDNIDFLNAVRLIQRFYHNKQKYYPITELVPTDNIISKQQQKYIFEIDELGKQRVLKKDYECIILRLLRKKLLHKEVWASGTYRYRNPSDDLPKDFEQKREEYCAMLNVPFTAKEFTNNAKTEMAKNIQDFDNSFPENELVNIIAKKGKPWIVLTPFEKATEPKVLHKIKEAILEKWGVINLLDILKEVDLREDFTDCFSTAGNRTILERDTIRKRLLFSIFSIFNL